MRASVVERQRKQNRKETIKSIAYAILAIPFIWAFVWLAYFATI